MKITKQEEQPTLQNEHVLLVPLQLADADSYFNLYLALDALDIYEEAAILPKETKGDFTGRIASLCTYIWTIRLAGDPDRIIGDCALHHWNKTKHEIEIGGALFPAYWGRGIMSHAFQLVMKFAAMTLEIKTIVGSTQTNNVNAQRMAHKLGFNIAYADGKNTILKLNVSKSI
ncbi:GNAT family N-acetyltransferase [Olivibacter sp. SA151]|uniref:GNAT family N-acetyltransferase n=1 Tax=Olivibacter jilunii TaxID=985016 RepID=UPI003F1637B7